MPSTINVGGSGNFKATSAINGSYSLSNATSPLTLTPPTGKVIRLVRLTIVEGTALSDTTISVGGVDFINSALVATPSGGSANFNVNCPNSGETSNSSRGHAGSIEPITASEPDTSITITTTDTTTEIVYYSVSYGDLE